MDGSQLVVVVFASFFRHVRFCHCCCQTQSLGLEVFSFVIVTALMSVASVPQDEYLYILAVNQRWKCTYMETQEMCWMKRISNILQCMAWKMIALNKIS